MNDTLLVKVTGTVSGLGKTTVVRRLAEALAADRHAVATFTEDDVLHRPEFADVIGALAAGEVPTLDTLLRAADTYARTCLADTARVHVQDMLLPFTPSLLACEALIAQAAQHASSRHAWLHAIARFDASREWHEQRYRSCAAWLAHRCGLSRSTAKEQVRVARALASGDFAETGNALAHGRISYSQARVICTIPADIASTSSVQSTMVSAAEHHLSVEDLTVIATRVRLLADEIEAREHRGLTFARGVGGGLIGTLDLDPVDGELLLEAIDTQLAAERAAGVPVVPVDAAAALSEPARPRHDDRATP